MEKMKSLVEQLNKYAHEYYVLDNPTVSDKEYDVLYDQLRKLEEQTGVVLNNSPTKRVGGEPISVFKKHKHIERLYSLDKSTSLEEMFAFDKRINIRLCKSWSYIYHHILLFLNNYSRKTFFPNKLFF